MLARDGLVEKVHGGAVLPCAPGRLEQGFETQLLLEGPEKTAITGSPSRMAGNRAAVALIELPQRRPRRLYPQHSASLHRGDIAIFLIPDAPW